MIPITCNRIEIALSSTGPYYPPKAANRFEDVASDAQSASFGEIRKDRMGGCGHSTSMLGPRRIQRRGVNWRGDKIVPL